jgi:hypothetical protein
VFHNHPHLSSGAGTIGQKWSQYKEHSPTSLTIKKIWWDIDLCPYFWSPSPQKNDLKMRKISAKLVPRILDRWTSEYFIWILHNVEIFDRVVSGDETWCFQYDPEIERQSMQWETQNSPWPKYSTHVSLVVQELACVFLRSRGVSSLWIHCTRTRTIVLFRSADKITGIYSEEKT